MLRCLIAVLAVFVAVPSATLAQDSKPSVSIETEYLMTLDAPIDPAFQPVGPRLIVNVPSGGTVSGPKIHGTVIPPAGDWLYVMPDGTFRLDVRGTIKTDDGELIFFEYGGVIATSKEVMDRFGAGEVITYKDEYFITTPRFTTASKKYAWLGQIQAVGKMVSVQTTRVKYDIFAVR